MSTETEHVHDIARGEDVFRGVYVETCMVNGCPYLRERPRWMKPFRGVVADAGGGEVRIVVERDTEEYPSAGTSVEVSAISHPSPLTATENARDIALASADGLRKDRDRWMEVADRLAEAMNHASDDGYCTLTMGEHAALATYHQAKSRGVEP